MSGKGAILPGVRVCGSSQSVITGNDLHQSGVHALERGEYSQAARFFLKALAEREQDPADLATSSYYLGRSYSYLQDYAKAEASLTRALSMRGKILGLEHADVATVIDELGLVYFNWHKYSQAEPLLRRGLEMRKKLLGQRHPQVAQSMVSVAGWCETQKKSAQAGKLLQEALAIQETALGSEHLELAPTFGLLAVHALNQHDLLTAEKCARRSLALRESYLHNDHPDVAVTLHIIAMIELRKGNFASAERAYRRALMIRERTLPPGHSGISSVLKHLGVTYYCQNKFAEAEEVYTQLEGISEIGANTPDLLTAWRQRSWLKLRAGKLDECQSFTVGALKRMKELGVYDKKTNESLMLSLFSCYLAQKKYLLAAKTLPGTALAVGRKLWHNKNAKYGKMRREFSHSCF